MAATNPKTVIVIGDRGLILDGTAHESLTPGKQVVQNSDLEWAVAAAQTVQKTFVVEGISDDIDTAYSADASCRVYTFRSGEVGYVYVDGASAIAIGDELESKGTGNLAKYAAGSVGADSQAIGRALEAKASGIGRIKVRFF